MNNITRREKFLIILCIIIVVGALGTKFVVNPLLSTRKTLQERLESLESEKILMDTKLGNATIVEQSHNDNKAKYEKEKEKYYAWMPNEDIDFILTGLCLENKLQPTLLGITDQVAEPEEGVESIETQLSGGELTSVQVSMNIRGTYENMMSFIDAIDLIPSVQLTRLVTSTTSLMDGETVGTLAFSATFSVIMVIG